MVRKHTEGFLRLLLNYGPWGYRGDALRCAALADAPQVHSAIANELKRSSPAERVRSSGLVKAGHLGCAQAKVEYE